jgi:hypothetical protein
MERPAEKGFDTLKLAIKSWENNQHQEKDAGSPASSGSHFNSIAKVAVLAVGGYLLWSNRTRVQGAIQALGRSLGLRNSCSAAKATAPAQNVLNSFSKNKEEFEFTTFPH